MTDIDENNLIAPHKGGGGRVRRPLVHWTHANHIFLFEKNHGFERRRDLFCDTPTRYTIVTVIVDPFRFGLCGVFRFF